jgi:phage tail P2-like protein
MSNTVYNIDFTRSLPTALKNDETIYTLGRVIAAELQENIRMSRLNIIYPRIDELDEYLLDILAYDLHIDWYDPDAPPDIKRTLIKESVSVHKRLGTKYAVESVIRAYFGSGDVTEWHEYGGRPHYFKITTTNPSITDEQAKLFFKMLGIVKRKSSWLEKLIIYLTGEMFLYVGFAYKEFIREAHVMGASNGFDIEYLTALCERAVETHAMGLKDRFDVEYFTLFHEQTGETHIIGNKRFNAIFGALLHERTSEQHTIKEELS